MFIGASIIGGETLGKLFSTNILIYYYRVAHLSTSTHLFLVHLIGSVYDTVQTLVYDRENVAFHIRRMGHEMPDVSNAFLVEFLQLSEHLRH